MKIVVLLACLSYVLLAAESIHACTCDLRPPACSDYWRNDAVFVGTVRKVNATENSPDPFAFETVEISVDESFRGVTTGFVRTYNYGHSCGFHFKPGGSYLFYGLLPKANEFETSLCARTTSLKPDLVDLEFLRAVKNDRPVYWAWGTIGEQLAGPRKGIRAEVLGQRTKIEGVSNIDGDIKLEVPKPGTYRIRIHLPKGQADINALRREDTALGEMQRKQIVGGRFRGNRPYVDYRVKVEPNRCGWFDVSIPYKR